jgi:hypothetical protein
MTEEGGGGGGAPKRKRLGKHNFEFVKGWIKVKQNNSIKGWVISIYCYFQSMTHSNIKRLKCFSANIPLSVCTPCTSSGHFEHVSAFNLATDINNKVVTKNRFIL